MNNNNSLLTLRPALRKQPFQTNSFRRRAIPCVVGAPLPVRALVPPPVQFVPREDNIAKLRKIAAMLSQQPKWVKWQAQMGHMPHYAIERRGAPGKFDLTFPVDQVLQWHAQKFGRNLLPEPKPLRQIVAA